MLGALRLRPIVTMLVALVVGVAGSIATMIVVSSPSNAETCWQYVEVSPGKWRYVNTCEGDGGTEDPPPDGEDPQEPECYQGRLDSFSYDRAECRGDLTCYLYLPPPSKEDPADWPERPPGTPQTAIYGEWTCFTQPPEEAVAPGGGPEWIDDPEVNWLDEAQSAIGAVVLPDFDLAFSPETQTYVAVETAFWAQGASGDPLEGTSALGLVAIATPDRFELDPGDGTGVKTCDFAVAEASGCDHTYPDASVDGATTANGEPAYAAQARLVYTVAFTLGGAPFTIPGAPTELPSEWEETGVPVGEVQVIIE